MKYDINVIKSVWRRLHKPGRATLAAIHSQNSQKTLLTQTLDSTVWQLIARLEADRRDLLTMAKAVVHSRDMNVDRRPSSVSINVLHDTIARLEQGKPGMIRKEEEKAA
jgi:hypothetical protein